MSNIWHDIPKPFFVLAPMEAVTDVVFRHVIAQAAAPDLWFSEFTNATGWVHAGDRAIGGRLIKTDDEHPIIAQIWGGEPGDMEQLAVHCHELGYDGIDINMGCPAKSAVKSGGSALIRDPELAAASIAAAKTAGLPVSVKTRLGYTHVDEWRDWLTHLLRQDIVNVTIHLRTKREMSKVPAHHELIPEIIKLRDEIAPGTLLTINGDIRDRAHGLEVIAANPGVDGIMIGRGIFMSPFAFANVSGGAHPSDSLRNESEVSPPPPEARLTARAIAGERAVPLSARDALPSRGVETVDSVRDEDCLSEASSAGPTESAVDATSREATAARDDSETANEIQTHERKQGLLVLLNTHLDLFDYWQPTLGRPYETLKRFYKIYIRDFDGASEIRNELMQTKSTSEARAIIQKIS